MLPEQPLVAVAGHQRILSWLKCIWYHLIATCRLCTTTASAVQRSESRAAGHHNLQAQLTMGCFNIQERNQLSGSGDPTLGQLEKDGYLQPPLGQQNHQPKVRLLLWDVKFSHFRVNTAVGDSGICLPVRPALGQGLHLEPDKLPKGWKQQHLGHVPEYSGQCFLPWQANNFRTPSAFFLNFLWQEGCLVFK